MSSELRRIVKRREFGPRGMNIASSRTIARWEQKGIFPKRDFTLPGGEPAWYRDRVEQWLETQRVASEQ